MTRVEVVWLTLTM